MFYLKLLSSVSENEIPDLISDFSNAISTLTFQIPDQVYQAFVILTRYVGYIMPLRLYTPIITVILGYWFIMVFGAFTKFTFNLIKRVVTFFTSG